MTVFEGWVKACEEMNQQIALLEQCTTRTGEVICLYSIIKEIPPMRETGWNCTYQKHYILWYNYERFHSFVDYCQAFQTYQNHYNYFR